MGQDWGRLRAFVDIGNDTTVVLNHQLRGSKRTCVLVIVEGFRGENFQRLGDASRLEGIGYLLSEVVLEAVFRKSNS